MLCERCAQREATINLTMVRGGAVTQEHLCVACGHARDGGTLTAAQLDARAVEVLAHLEAYARRLQVEPGPSDHHPLARMQRAYLDYLELTGAPRRPAIEDTPGALEALMGDLGSWLRDGQGPVDAAATALFRAWRDLGFMMGGPSSEATATARERWDAVQARVAALVVEEVARLRSERDRG